MIALRKSSTPLGSLAYDGGVSSTDQRIINPLIFMEPTLKVVRSSGRTLRGRGYKHHLYSYKIFQVTIGPDAFIADGSLRVFLEALLQSPYMYIAPAVGDDYVEVLHESDEIAPEYVNNMKVLPQLTLTLTAVEPT